MEKENKRIKQIKKIAGNFSQIGRCLKCLKGSLVKRGGKFGFFWGCSRFPYCNYTQQIEEYDLKKIYKK